MHRLRFRVLEKTKCRKPLILLGFQRFISSFIFDYFALMSDFGESLENRLPNRHGGSNPSACANKNGLLLAGRPIFIATIKGDEPEGFAYRRHTAYHDAQSIRGICVARRGRLKFIPKRNSFYKPHPEQHTPLPAPL